MLEGLRIVEITLQRVYATGITRMEAEFYNSERLPYSDSVKASNCILFSQYGTSKELNEERKGYPVLRLNEFDSSFITEPAKFCNLINKETFKKLKLHKDDVLICRTNGNPKLVGKSALVPKEYDFAFASYLFRVRPNKSIINSATLVAYLNCKYGRMEIERYSMVGNQANFSPAKFLEISIPKFPVSVNAEVEKLTYLSFDKLELSKHLYFSAEDYLLECLGMQDFAANPDAYNVKTLKESFLESGRIDAEYYLPKYEDYIKAVSAYAGGVAPLGEVCVIKDGNYTPERGVKYRYIELANIGRSGDITGCTYENGEDLPTRARRIVTQGDVIVSSIEGSLSSCALITDDYDNALCSTGFYVVRSTQINSETLLTLFKSFPIQQLLKKGCSGTILTGIGKQEFENIPIPLILPEVQEEIAQHVRQSFALRKKASQLLEEAKLSVEHVIETGGGKYLIYNSLQNELARHERFAMWLLLKELGVMDNTQDQQRAVVTVKRFSLSFLVSGRLDAEYYQPKYDYLDMQLSTIPTKRLGEVVEIQKSIEPGREAYQEEGVPFVRVADLSKFGLDSPSVRLDRKAFATALRPKKDTILLSKDGSVGIACKMDEDADVITSGAILHLSVKVKDVLPDYLTLLLNSPIVRMQAERDAGGSIIQHWKPSEIAQVVIPILPAYIQKELSERVSKSFALRKESKALLDEAKLMVEQAIEYSA